MPGRRKLNKFQALAQHPVKGITGLSYFLPKDGTTICAEDDETREFQALL
jgi:hypothetical protein